MDRTLATKTVSEIEAEARVTVAAREPKDTCGTPVYFRAYG